LRDTIYFREYFEEKIQSYIDNLNLLYVAQTRAEEVFISYSPETENKDLKTIADLLLFTFRNAQNFSNDFNGNTLLSIADYWNEDEKYFELGSLPNKKSEKDETLRERTVDYPASLLDDRLKLRSHSADYFDFSEAESVEAFSPVSRGNILHQLFQLINYSDDLEKAVNQLEFEGKLDEKQAKEVFEFAKELLSDPKVETWFSRKWIVVNERDILKGGSEVYRPDRVIYNDEMAIVIDFKFGKKKSKSYEKQVAVYKDLIKSIGFNVVEAYILYGKRGEIVAV
jgi:ATP-dependent exoDNAse (exonuclease V) beta subunit